MSQGVSNVKTELSDSNNRSSIISDIRSSSSENEEADLMYDELISYENIKGDFVIRKD